MWLKRPASACEVFLMQLVRSTQHMTKDDLGQPTRRSRQRRIRWRMRCWNQGLLWHRSQRRGHRTEHFTHPRWQWTPARGPFSRAHCIWSRLDKYSGLVFGSWTRRWKSHIGLCEFEISWSQVIHPWTLSTRIHVDNMKKPRLVFDDCLFEILLLSIFEWHSREYRHWFALLVQPSRWCTAQGGNK